MKEPNKKGAYLRNGLLDKCFTLIDMLDNRMGVTKEQIAERLGVHERSVKRYLQSCEKYIVIERGEHAGPYPNLYRLKKRWK